MNIFRRRRMRKRAEQYLHAARHARAMREDIAAPEDLHRLDEAAAALRMARREGDEAAFETAADRLAEAVRAVHPPRGARALREWVEMIAVAGAVAFAFRTYFVQPFKIPTGSMQPTLYGVTAVPQEGRRWIDYPPLSWVGWSLLGEGYVETRSKVAGTLSPMGLPGEEFTTVFVDRTPHAVRKGLPLRVEPGTFVPRGSVLASGRVRMGDHVFVNKVLYNFRKPRRGEIIVFDTDLVEGLRRTRPNTFYIKRLVGLPGETIAIDPPHLVADGERVTEPPPFRRLVEETARGYNGYRFWPGSLLSGPGDRIVLPADHYLPFGDNTTNSLDGRVFGALPREALVGPAFAVYWPFSERWGLAR
jgi:signal peptidase I